MSRLNRKREILRASVTVDATAALDLSLLAILWSFCVVVVNPAGNFPLADDWAYGLTLKHLIDTGEYRPQGYAHAPIITNIIWGWLFCTATGFGYTALRLSTLVASLLGIAGLYILIRDFSHSRAVSWICALTLALNPIYFALSFTFDTDVLFTALLIWSVFCFARYFRSGSSAAYLVGTALAVAATLSRQLALCVPVAFGCALLLRSGFSARTVMLAAIPGVVSTASYFALRIWLIATGKSFTFLDWNSYSMFGTFSDTELLARTWVSNAYVLLVYLGLCTLPVLLRSITDLFRSQRRYVVILLAIGSVAILAGAVVRAQHRAYSEYHNPVVVPMLGDMLHPWGVGWLVWVPGLDWKVSNPLFDLWVAVTIAGALAAVLLIAKFGVDVTGAIRKSWRDRTQGSSDGTHVFVLLAGLTYLLPLLFIDSIWDRYIIPAVPIFLAVLARSPDSVAASSTAAGEWIRRSIVLSLLAMFGLFSVAATRDYLTWNRVRWGALQSLMNEQHIDPGEINGGWEFNGFYAYDPNYKERWNPMDRENGPQPVWRKRLRWAAKPHEPTTTFVAAFGPLPGYSVFREYTYRHWLPPHTQRVLVLRKAGDASGD